MDPDVCACGAASLTVGEVTAAAGTWHLAFALAPAHHERQYQALFSTNSQLSRIAGPALLVPLVLAIGTVGWAVLGMLLLGACPALRTVARD